VPRLQQFTKREESGDCNPGGSEDSCSDLTALKVSSRIGKYDGMQRMKDISIIEMSEVGFLSVLKIADWRGCRQFG
jgi:hypothetical protein